MNILFLSHLSGASYSGPTYSVPKQIEAQSKLDNIFWYNTTTEGRPEWKTLPYYHDLNEFPFKSIYKLPSPFDNPDLIVVEQFYNMTVSKLRKELVKGNIPYIIIPRGELTKQAQARKKIKKKAANLIFCYRYAKTAAAIQFLTDQEYHDSGDAWNKNHIVIPNGIDKKHTTKEKFSDNGIKCISVGRIEPYQKGLDLLIEVCRLLKAELEKENCTITICGPDREGKLASLKKQVKNGGLDRIILFKEGVYGQKKERLLLENDVFLIPSRFEGHPMGLMEALSYGLPCIATTGSNMRPDIEEYNAGWTADNKADSLAEAFKSMIKQKNKFEEKRAGALRLSEKYDWRRIAVLSHQNYELFVNNNRKK